MKPPRLLPQAGGGAKGSLAGALLALLLLAAGTQEPAFRDQLAVHWVLVPVVVRGPQGHVTGLGREHFRLFVDDRPVEVASFETDDEAPIGLIYLQDLSGSIANAGKQETSRAALSCLLDRLSTHPHRPAPLAPAELMLATFRGGRVELQVPLTTDPQALRAAAADWQPRGTTALHDAVAELPRLQTQLSHYKQAAVLVTDGEDNASFVLPGLARELVRRARLPVYVLGLGGGQPLRRVPILPATPEAPADLLYLLAAETGGRYRAVANPQQAVAACADVVDDLRHQYVLGFPTAEGASSYHSLRVELRDAGHRQISFRRGYLGGPPQGG